MKFLILCVLLMTSTSFAATKVFEVVCIKNDCLKNGWFTQGNKNFEVATQCKGQDCSKFGWASLINGKATDNVTCKAGGCFREGWSSSQTSNGNIYSDEVLCKKSNCLKNGWKSQKGLDLMGANVTCAYRSCSKYGTRGFWYGKPVQTVCNANNCYKHGWTLYSY